MEAANALAEIDLCRHVVGSVLFVVHKFSKYCRTSAGFDLRAEISRIFVTPGSASDQR
jgi:hypothetical protein